MLTIGPQPEIEGSDAGIAANSRHRCHIQDAPELGASAPDIMAAAHVSTVAPLADEQARALEALVNPTAPVARDADGGEKSPARASMLHQHALSVTEPGLFAGAPSSPALRCGIGDRLVGRVSAPLAVEIHARIAGISRRCAITGLFAIRAQALERRPGLDQRAVNRKVFVTGQLQLTRLCHHRAEKLARHIVAPASVPGCGYRSSG
jgi:hypothetical protein